MRSHLVRPGVAPGQSDEVRVTNTRVLVSTKEEKDLEDLLDM